MNIELHQYSRGAVINRPYTVEEMFAYSVRFEVIVLNEEEFDYFFAMQLMFGRELEIKTWVEWKEEYDVCATIDHRYKKVPLPVCFTTFPIDFSGLR